MKKASLRPGAGLVCLLAASSLLVAQGRGGQTGTTFPGGRMNADGSLMPASAMTTLFSQDAYTQYEILEPGSEAFAITYLLESARAGATEITNPTRAGSMGTNISVFDPRTGLPVKFTYDQGANGQYAIRASLPFPVPEGGLRNTVVLPAGWEVSGVSQSATVGRTRDDRMFVALVNLNAENHYRVTIRARKP